MMDQNPNAYLRGLLTVLTPKQYALLWIEEVRRFDSYAAFYESEIKKPPRCWAIAEAVVNVAEATRRQAEAWDPERVHSAVCTALRDFSFLKHMIDKVNDDLSEILRVAYGEATVLVRLLSLADFYMQVAEDAERVVKVLRLPAASPAEPESTEQERQRQAILRRLRHYRLPPRGRPGRARSKQQDRKVASIPCVSLAREIREECTDLAWAVYLHDHAVRVISKKYFGGHAILARDVERTLARTMEWLDSFIKGYNRFVDQWIVPSVGATLPNADRSEIERLFGDGWTIGVTEIRKRVSMQDHQPLVRQVEDACRCAVLAMTIDPRTAGPFIRTADRHNIAYVCRVPAGQSIGIGDLTWPSF